MTKTVDSRPDGSLNEIEFRAVLERAKKFNSCERVFSVGQKGSIMVYGLKSNTVIVEKDLSFGPTLFVENALLIPTHDEKWEPVNTDFSLSDQNVLENKYNDTFLFSDIGKAETFSHFLRHDKKHNDAVDAHHAMMDSLDDLWDDAGYDSAYYDD